MSDKIILDIETRSNIDLPKRDLWTYAHSIHTGINCLATFNGKSELYDWATCQNPKSPRMIKLYDQLQKNGFVGHNSRFELWLLDAVYGWQIDPSKVDCTMARCAYFNLPQGLDKALKELKAPQLKDLGGGTKAMKDLSKVDERGRYTEPSDEYDKYQQLYAYCVNDCEVTAWLDKALPKLPANEREIWLLDERINKRGIPIDWFLVENARCLIENEAEKYDNQVFELTNGELNSARELGKLADWLSEQIGNVTSVNKENIDELLAIPGLPTKVIQVLTIRQQSGLSSLAKFRSLKEAMDKGDSRIRDNFWYFGAHTGRWTGKGAQTHNIVKGCDVELSEALHTSSLEYIKAVYDKPLESLKNAIRGSFYAGEDNVFIGVDLSQIEARCSAWLAGDERKLSLYKSGLDIYCDFASKLFGRKITKADEVERNAGKVAELSLGFGGGIGALERNCVKYKIDIGLLDKQIEPTTLEHEKAQWALDWYYKHGGKLHESQALTLDTIKQRWRAENRLTVRMWDELFNGFKAGIYDGQLIQIRKTPQGGGRIVKLPSGSERFYRDLLIEGNDVSYAGGRGRKSLTKGKFFENVVQSLDREIITWFMTRADQIAPIIHHSHDEYMVEVKEEHTNDIHNKLIQLHRTKPKWTANLPITFQSWTGKRYEK
jgi:DNA polymerase bacteriophage-type